MKMIIAIIRPERLRAVKDALKAAGVNGITITHVTGRGSQSGIKFTTRTGEFCVDEIEKVKIEIVTDDELTETVINTIRENAETGHIGDGRIIVVPVESFTKIRTGGE